MESTKNRNTHTQRPTHTHDIYFMDNLRFCHEAIGLKTDKLQIYICFTLAEILVWELPLFVEKDLLLVFSVLLFFKLTSPL